jgi:flagellar hook protein FlgE
MPGFYIPLSGLDADTTSLNTIANNLSNMSTTGFKEQTTNFSDLFYQQLGSNGSGDQIQVGTGVQVASNSTDFTSGAISSTGVSTDAAIDGSGFFILDNNGSQLYTRAGDFQLSSTGNLQSSTGQGVMGYAATNGVVSTSGGLTDLNIPTGKVMQPSATTNFSMTQNLDSTAAVGASTTGQVQVYDSLGNSYEATITYTKTGNNTWGYSISLPDQIQAASTPSANAQTYQMASPTSTVDPATNLVITGPTATNGVTATITAPAVTAGETLSSYAASLNTAIAAAGITGVSVSSTSSGQLAIVGAGVTTSGKLLQDPVTNAATTTSTPTPVKTFYFASGSSTVNPATNLTITGPTAVTGETATITAPTVTAGESLSSYAASLNAAMATAGITGVNASASSTGQLAITGSGVITSGNVIQDPISNVLQGSRSNNAATYYFSSANSTVDSSSNLVITGPTATAGVTSSITAPTVTTGQTLAQYAAALNTALGNAVPPIVGVTVSATATGQLSITGSGFTTTGNVVQATEVNVPNASSATPGTSTYTFAANSLVGPDTNLSLTVPKAVADGGGTATVNVALSHTPETVADYAADLNTAFAGFAAANTHSGTLTATPVGNTITITSTGAAAGFTSTGNVLQVPETNITNSTAATPAVSTFTFGANTIVGADTSQTFSVPVTLNGPQAITVTPTQTPETLADYVTDLNNAFNAANCGPATHTNGSTVTAALGANNSITITAAGVAATGITPGGTLTSAPATVTQAATAGTNNIYSYSLGSSTASVDPSTNLTITGPNANGIDQTITAPTVVAGENLSTYATSLNTQLTRAGIVGVTVSASAAGQLTISGNNITTTGNLVQAQTAALPATQSTTFTLSSALSKIDPNTDLTITAPTQTGPNATVLAPPFVASQSLAAYATSLQNALAGADVSGVTVSAANGQLSISGANVSIGGNLVQDPITSVTNSSATAGTASYQLSSGTATVDPNTSLTIHGFNNLGQAQTATVNPANIPAGGDSLAAYTTALSAAVTAAGIQGVTISPTLSGQLSITGPSNTTFTGNLVQNQGQTTLSGTSGTSNIFNYSLASASSTIDPASNLTITGQNASGETVTIPAPTVSSGESLANYVASLNTALTAAGISSSATGSSGVGVSFNAGGQMTISGTNISVGGSIIEDPGTFNLAANSGAITTISYPLASSNATIAQATNLTITGPTAVAGVSATTTLPSITPGETLTSYAASLNTALQNAGIVGAHVSSTALGVLNITGTNLSTSGNVVQDQVPTAITASTGEANSYSYNFASSNGTLATVNPTTNLTITGPTEAGGSGTIVAPTVVPGETLAQYVTALNEALGTAGIVGATVSASAGGSLKIAGVNITTSGNVVADPVASSNTTGTLSFDGNGNLVTPASNVTNITFGGLSDGAAPISMTWDLAASSTGTSTISQTAAASSTSKTNQNGYSAGEYQGFTISSTGLITAQYSNYQTLNVGQLALATVSNEQGLVDAGSTEYQTTEASGDASVGVAGTGGRGTLEGSSLEASNVNISTEFSDLIIAQRAFEASSKTITTFDTITQETINMIH